MEKLISSTSNFVTRDPHMTKHNGLYYHCFTEDAKSVSISCADTIENLSNAQSKKVYIPEEHQEYSHELWAPELHIIDHKCYIYVACDDGDNRNHRMYVLENGSSDPLNPYIMHGKITDKTDKWAIDGTVMEYDGERYFIWSGWEGDINVCQNLYIAKMKNPYEIHSERVMISTPEYDWEKLGSDFKTGYPYVNEGAYVFTVDNQLYMTYSAAGSWCQDYCIAVLKLVGTDPLNPSAWKKMSVPVFSGNEKVKGAGHCSVVCGDNILHVFFHAWDREEKDIKWNKVSVWHAEMKITDDKISII